MARFTVLHLTLSDEMVDEINNGGGWSCPCGAVYANLLMPPRDGAEDRPDNDAPDSLDQRILEGLALRLYHVVAEVEVETLDRVFPLTNHIDHDWRENPGVVCVRGERVRSTSVGDLVLEHAGGSVYSCAPVGWTRVDNRVVVDAVRRLAREPGIFDVSSGPHPAPAAEEGVLE